MKVSEVIEKLKALDPDAEIKLWNGFVGDIQDLDPEFMIQELRRVSKEFMQRCFEGEILRNKQFSEPLTKKEESEAKKDAEETERPWDLNKGQWEEDWLDSETKPIVLLQALPSGKSTFDRCGTIEY